MDSGCQIAGEELLVTPAFDASECTKVSLLFSSQFQSAAGVSGKVFLTTDAGMNWSDVLTLNSTEGPNWKEIDISTDAAGEPGVSIAFTYVGDGGFWAIDNVYVLCQPSDLVFKSTFSPLSSPEQKLMVRNTGTADLNIQTIESSGPNALDFQKRNDGCGGQTLAPSEKCTVGVLFSPEAPGDKEVDLTITSSDLNSPTQVAMSGQEVHFLANRGEGTIGTEIMLTGNEFGTKKGKVTLGTSALKILDWENGVIQGLVSKVLTSGPYDITVQPKEPKGAPAQTESDIFTFKGPEIYWVGPGHGAVGDQITIKGRYFGTKKGKVLLGTGEKPKSCKVISWTMDTVTGHSQVVFVVPKGLTPGEKDLTVSGKGGSVTMKGGFTID